MSLTREVTVWCDECGHWSQGMSPARAVRKRLRRKGWTQKGTQDFCPNCSTKEEGEEEEADGS